MLVGHGARRRGRTHSAGAPARRISQAATGAHVDLASDSAQGYDRDDEIRTASPTVAEAIPAPSSEFPNPGRVRSARRLRADLHVVGRNPASNARQGVDASGGLALPGETRDGKTKTEEQRDSELDHHTTPIKDDVRPSGTRRKRTDSLTTGDANSDFGDRWAEVEPGIRDLLRARGIPFHDQADLVQEVAIRAFHAHSGGTITTSFERWCKAVARNASVDAFRRSRLIDLTDEFDAPAQGAAVEEHVQHRLALEAVAKVWPGLADDERELLLDPSPPSDPAARNHHYVTVHRLRRRVQLLAESAMLGVLGLSYRLRQRWMTVSGATAIATVGVVASFAIIPSGDGNVVGSSEVGSYTRAAESGQPTATSDSDAYASETADATRGLVGDSRKTHIDSPLPGGNSGYVYTKPPAPDDPLVCAGTPPVSDRTCVPHPLRQNGGNPLDAIASNVGS